MKAGIFYGPFDIRVEEVPDPQIQKPTDAIVKVTYTCICGSDLWWYRAVIGKEKGSRTGHEFMGDIIEVGNGVKKVKAGDLVVGPFAWCDGTCPLCKAGMSSECINGGGWGTDGMDGCQGEQLRVPFADANLFPVPKDKQKEELMPSLLTLSDVLGTGHYAAVTAGVTKNSVVAVVGDGAVGLCASLASKRLGAKRIIHMSHHEYRSRIGKKFGATDIIEEKGTEAIKRVKGITDKLGVDSALECVGTKESWQEVMGMVRKGGKIGAVGLPADVPDIKVSDIFWNNLTVGGGPAPTTTYIPQLMPDVLSGKIDSSAIFDLTLPLSELPKGYEAMDKRKAIKVLIKPF